MGKYISSKTNQKEPGDFVFISDKVDLEQEILPGIKIDITC